MAGLGVLDLLASSALPPGLGWMEQGAQAALAGPRRRCDCTCWCIDCVFASGTRGSPAFEASRRLQSAGDDACNVHPDCARARFFARALWRFFSLQKHKNFYSISTRFWSMKKTEFGKRDWDF